MREVLKKAGLAKEFHERRIDPFLEVEQYDFDSISDDNSVTVNLLPEKLINKISKAS